METNDTNLEYLKWKIMKGWKKKNIPNTKEYVDRIKYELSVVEQMKFGDYFLIIEDFISWAKSNGIPIGPGRGSGSGSLICYALDITTLDPIKFGLIFERFLNPGRMHKAIVLDVEELSMEEFEKKILPTFYIDLPN